MSFLSTKNNKSLPLRGAWIEIAIEQAAFQDSSGRSPCGGRGLKFKDVALARIDFAVAPLAGGVD